MNHKEENQNVLREECMTRVYNPMFSNISMGFRPLTPAFQMQGQPVVSSTVCFASSDDEYVGGQLPKVPDAPDVVHPTKRKQRVKCSDEEIAAALEHVSTIKDAAKELNVQHQYISQRITGAAEESVLAVFKGRFKKGAPVKWSDGEIAAVLEHATSISEAALQSNISRETIHRRIARAAEESALAVFKGKFKRGWPSSTRDITNSSNNKVRDKELVDALSSAVSIPEAAAVLGVSKQAIYRRIARAAEDSALAVFKGGGHLGSFKKKWNDEEIAAVLSAGKTMSEAAGVLEIARATVGKRIARAKGNSPLAAFKGKYKRGGQIKLSDEEIIAALSAAKTMSKAAQALGSPLGTVASRIARASDDSPLVKYRGTFKCGGHNRKCSDEEIAAELSHATSMRAAARRLKVSDVTVLRRVAHAAKDSPLAQFKDKFMRGSRRAKNSEEDV